MPINTTRKVARSYDAYSNLKSACNSYLNTSPMARDAMRHYIDQISRSGQRAFNAYSRLVTEYPTQAELAAVFNELVRPAPADMPTFHTRVDALKDDVLTEYTAIYNDSYYSWDGSTHTALNTSPQVRSDLTAAMTALMTLVSELILDDTE